VALLAAHGASPWSPGPHPGVAAIILALAFLIVPLATALLLGGTSEGLRALRAHGWRAHPAAWAVLALGALGSAAGLTAILLFVRACVRDAL
jgi:hypothetical protein